MKIFRYLAFSALLAMSVSSANTQDYDKGVAAIIAGDFETAWSELLPLAESGNADTQYNIGMMYLKGEGVIQNYVPVARNGAKFQEVIADFIDCLEGSLPDAGPECPTCNYLTQRLALEK